MRTPIHGANGTATSSRASSVAVVNQGERVNGWTCPWHPLQFVAWFFLVFFSTSYFGVHVFYLPREWWAAGFIIPGGLCAIHLIYHFLALTIDPADRNIRGGPKKDKAFFDRSRHQHVIENFHCYICQSDVGSKSKHCSVCNKCVSDFDHHCKWLNNCVGGRNYRLFIGCISSAFVLAVIVFVVTLYAFIAFFDDRDHLKSLTGGKFEMFAPINDDRVFVIFTGVVGALLLLAIALLGHLLGFHIYLICHKMSTYDFIVSSRGRQSDNIDLEAGHNKSPPRRKLFKNQVKPEEDRKQSLGNEQIELTGNARSEGSQDNLCSEPTVKIINEVSSKAAAKQSKPSTDQENVGGRRPSGLHSPPKESSVIGQYSPRGVTEPSSSEESLKEITPSPPRVVVQAPHDVSGASTSMPHHFRTQYGADTSSPRPGTSWEKSDDDGEELLPSPRGKRPRKRGPSAGGSPRTATTYRAEAQQRKMGDAHESNGNCTVESSGPAKKKRRQLPPLVIPNKRRPLPSLQPED